MARLWQSGFELDSGVAQVEWSNAAAGPRPLTLSTTTVRSGVYAGRLSSLSSGNPQDLSYAYNSAAVNGPYFIRVYVRFATLPTAENRFILLNNSAVATTGPMIWLTVDNAGALRLYDEDSVIGSASSALSLNTWYRIEIKFDRTAASGSHIVTARIDGVDFASASNRALSSGPGRLHVGGNLGGEVQTTGDWFFDDIAINDTTGSSQTSYPGSGKIIHLKPNAAGDVNTFATQVGGTAGSSNNFTRVNEVPPDDATTYNASTTLNQEDLFNCGDSGIGAYDYVALVAVGVRMANITATDAVAAIKVEIEKAASGTKSQSAAIIPNSTAFINNDPTAGLRNYPLVKYFDPDGAQWLQSTLDSLQIGYILSAANTRAVAISNIWASVEYIPMPIINKGSFFGLF